MNVMCSAVHVALPTVGEAAITGAALVLIRGARPDLLQLRDSRPAATTKLEPSEG